MHTYQLFSRSFQLIGKPYLVEALLTELETRRFFEVGSKKFRLLQCGETAILRNLKDCDYAASFRFPEYPKLLKRFNKIVADTDVFLNSIHSPMKGRFHIHEKRRAFLSANKRSCFSTSNFVEPKESDYVCIQRAFYNSNPIDFDSDESVNYIDNNGNVICTMGVYEIPD